MANEPLVTRANTQKDISDFVEHEQKAMEADLLKINCSGDNPQVKIGGLVDIKMSNRKALGFVTEDFGKFLVKTIYHHIDGVGHYTNSFEAIAGDTERMPGVKAERPNPDMQLATVMDNNDPKKQGRIKVQFKWTCTANDHTEWLRVLSPNAGNGDTGKNRGFLVVPEVGDQVIIAFEEGNIARPVVMGSVYPSNNVEAGFTDSHIKGMTSTKGSHLSFHDDTHALTLATSAANTLHVKEKEGSVHTQAAQVISHQTGENLIEIKNKDGSITLQSKTTITIKSGESSITLNTNGTIALIGKVIIIDGTTAVYTQGGKISSATKGIHVLTGSPVDIN
ncbi:uncharacterized protein involved in type VI secretion and phage assembly [Pedobacter sp. UYP30]|uniref:phage baseplate assembly protein V n=1 Tax=Pedobacter sp. UYP30 TaxID=1756400 RepID=UPI003397A513